MTDPNQHEAPAPSDSLSARPALQREGTRSAPLLREPELRGTPARLGPGPVYGLSMYAESVNNTAGASQMGSPVTARKNVARSCGR